MARERIISRGNPETGFPPLRGIGVSWSLADDSYHFILNRPWWHFIGILAAGFLAMNSLFALLYLAAPGCIANARAGSFEDAFYFSVQSLATIGYGGMTPATRHGHVVVHDRGLRGHPERGHDHGADVRQVRAAASARAVLAPHRPGSAQRRAAPDVPHGQRAPCS